MIYYILETIGNTPVIRLNRMAPEHVEMYVKVESFNPLASVKDRLAIAIIADAEKRGLLKPGQTVVGRKNSIGTLFSNEFAKSHRPMVASDARILVTLLSQ